MLACRNLPAPQVYAALLVPAVTFGLPLLGLRRAGPKVRCATVGLRPCAAGANRPGAAGRRCHGARKQASKALPPPLQSSLPRCNTRFHSTSHFCVPCLQAGESSQSTGSAPLSSKKKKGKAGKH